MKKFKITGLLPVIAMTAALAGMSVPQAAAAPVSVVAFGDSLSAGYGLNPGQAFPEQLERALRQRGLDVTVANAAVSGDTASNGLARLEWSVPADADIVIVEFGGNDALRGVDPAITRKALSGIVAKLKDRGQTVLLAGMLAPRNMGDRFAAQFNAIYPDIAAKYGVPLYPFFLEGVAANRSLNLPDGIHPSAEGIARIVNRILPLVERLVKRASISG